MSETRVWINVTEWLSRFGLEDCLALVFLLIMVFIRAHWGGGGRILTPMFKKINFGRAALLVDDR